MARDETGVGTAMAAGSHAEKGIWAKVKSQIKKSHYFSFFTDTLFSPLISS